MRYIILLVHTCLVIRKQLLRIFKSILTRVIGN
uniref:Uncharacterized protein n=1 Tax=Rhizophora mucronata TaxID=61149 RepID=A0A2P2N6Y7_RHIMU